MNQEEQLDTLKAEVVAVQAVLMSLFRHLATDHPDLVATFCRAFDEAESMTTGVAVKMGLDAPRETTIGALQVIEELRRAVIKDGNACG